MAVYNKIPSEIHLCMQFLKKQIFFFGFKLEAQTKGKSYYCQLKTNKVKEFPNNIREICF